MTPAAPAERLTFARRLHQFEVMGTVFSFDLRTRIRGEAGARDFLINVHAFVVDAPGATSWTRGWSAARSA